MPYLLWAFLVPISYLRVLMVELFIASFAFSVHGHSQDPS